MNNASMTDDFAQRLLAWHCQHGRHDLPWQHPRSPYRVWVSEIMLQQTQVGTVIGYFERFMARFPDIPALAAASEDQVLACWAGLGYYARARNLHAAARRIMECHGGRFPDDFEAVLALPGIGRSTAGAILAQSMGQRYPILDGNVRRVLARHAAIEGIVTMRAVEKRLWALAETRTPHENLPAYTQAIMDLGATLCRRSKPKCEQCPVADDCQALATGRVDTLPTRRRRGELPLRQRDMLLLSGTAGVLLERRPPVGIWGGLWSLPEVEPAGAAAFLARHGLVADGSPQSVGQIDHVFSHFRLRAHVWRIRVRPADARLFDHDRLLWYNERQSRRAGLPAPIKTFLAGESCRRDNTEGDSS